MSPAPRRSPERPLPLSWPVGEERITLTLTANAGVLVAWRDCKLLVDGIHAGGDHQFSAVPAPTLRRIVDGEPPFDNIGWLLFTHLHVDHFSAEYVRRFLERRPQVPLFLPAGNGGAGIDPEINALRAYLTEHASPVRELRLPYGRAVCYPLCPGARVTAFFAEHDGEQFEDTEHYCLLLSLGGRSLLFLGDAAQDPGYFTSVLAGTALDAVVTNPLFLNRPAGRDTLLALRPEKIVVDHIPFAREDQLRFREMVARNAERWRDLLPPMSVLWDEGDTLAI